MAAYLVGHIAIKNPSLWQQYVTGVKHSLENHDASVIFRGVKSAQLAGEEPRDHVVVIRFGDPQALDHWFNSAAYQQLIPLRDQAADVEISSFNEYE